MRSAVSLSACALLALSGAIASCTTALYPGPTRPRSEIATIGASGTRIESIDGRRVGDDTFAAHGAKYEIVAGHHTVAASLAAKNAGVSRRTFTSRPVLLHFQAEAGHRYVTAAFVNEATSTWEPRILDEASNASVSWYGED